MATGEGYGLNGEKRPSHGPWEGLRSSFVSSHDLLPLKLAHHCPEG